MPATPIYFDHAATTPLRPCARARVVEALDETGNPSSVHRFGRARRTTVERAREAVGRLANAGPETVVFTSGATEANHMAVEGLGRAAGRRTIVSAVEHDSVRAGADEELAVARDGRIDIERLDRRLGELSGPTLVSIMAVNNETGVIQPIAEAARIARSHGAIVHCDAVQAAGRIPLDIAALGVDALSLSAHKIGGPSGVGALVVRDGLEFVRLIRGGGQERGRRAGTENVAGIAGFGAAADEIRSLPDAERMGALAKRLRSAVDRTIPDVIPIGADAPRVDAVSCWSVPGVEASLQVMGLDLEGVAVSAGSACSSGKVRRSHVLAAMGLDDEIAGSAIRVSLGWTTTEDEIDRFVEVWAAVLARARRRVA